MKEPAQANRDMDPEGFRLEDFLPYRLSVAAETISRIMIRQHLSRVGLGVSEWRLLSVIGRYGVLSPTVAGAHTAMDKVKVSRAAASLVARGLLRQSQDPQDGRGRLLRLTRKGNSVYASTLPMAAAIEADLAAGLSKTEWTTLHRGLGKLMQHAVTLLGDNPEDDK